MVLSIEVNGLLEAAERGAHGEFVALVRSGRGEAIAVAADAVMSAAGSVDEETYVRDVVLVHDGVLLEYGGSMSDEEAEASLRRVAGVIERIDPHAAVVTVENETPYELRDLRRTGPSLCGVIVPSQVEEGLVDRLLEWTEAASSEHWYRPSGASVMRTSPLSFVRYEILRNEGWLCTRTGDERTLRAVVNSGEQGWSFGVSIPSEDGVTGLEAEALDLLREISTQVAYAAIFRTDHFGVGLASYATLARHGLRSSDVPQAYGQEHLSLVSEVFGAQLLTDRHVLPEPAPEGWRTETLDSGKCLLLADDLAPWFGPPAPTAESVNLLFDRSRDQFPDLVMRAEA